MSGNDIWTTPKNLVPEGELWEFVDLKEEPARKMRCEVKEVLAKIFTDVLKVLEWCNVPRDAIGDIKMTFDNEEMLKVAQEIFDDIMSRFVGKYAEHITNDYKATKLSQFWIEEIFKSNKEDNIDGIYWALMLRIDDLMKNWLTPDYAISLLNRLKEYYSNCSKEYDLENLYGSIDWQKTSTPKHSKEEYKKRIEYIDNALTKLEKWEKDIYPLWNYDDIKDVILDCVITKE